ncbi:MAG: hypothetical protein A2Y62_03400 [Candidatus Fischerbacteria bacterium RBG_13_37_8]|uniref:NorR-like AAA+ ATPase lid domain-containing protein n=1 Tax=Candidatus Fischerbacteria bacterium RBG_13_37_8 TaxID=1817863 RepID=A0A1F5VL57_9BACT|nr:MAG: hypothetical protein A2Y62_03400 [Candidatus Fischerbacteria bacterium RBG_13_37_8]
MPGAIEKIATYYWGNYCKRIRKDEELILKDEIKLLKTHFFAGNVRELTNILEKYWFQVICNGHCSNLDYLRSLLQDECHTIYA